MQSGLNDEILITAVDSLPNAILFQGNYLKNENVLVCNVTTSAETAVNEN